MDIISVQKILGRLKDLKGDRLFYDVHMHPFEVMFSPLTYQPSPVIRGLYCSGDTKYAPPEVGAMRIQDSEHEARQTVDHHLQAKVALLKARQIYAHTGPRVFDDHMALGVVDRALLLPIVGTEGSGHVQLELMRRMFGEEDRYAFGYCLPNSIPNHKIADDVQLVLSEYDIWALKIHPAVTGIDLTSQKGRDRIEAILDASRKHRLKVIIHGGKSPACQNAQARSFGALIHLQHIDWSITSETVVIAHCGSYGHSRTEAQETVLPLMCRLLKQYPHLAVDTSGISFEVLRLALKAIDTNRMLFGSDALYEKPWAALVKLWLALEKEVSNPEEALLLIASDTPAGFFHPADGSRQSGRDQGRQRTEVIAEAGLLLER